MDTGWGGPTLQMDRVVCTWTKVQPSKWGGLQMTSKWTRVVKPPKMDRAVSKWTRAGGPPNPPNGHGLGAPNHLPNRHGGLRLGAPQPSKETVRPMDPTLQMDTLDQGWGVGSPPNPSRLEAAPNPSPNIGKSMTGPFGPEHTPNATPKICFMVLALTGYGLFPSKPKIGKSNPNCEEVFECWLAWLRLALVLLVMSSIWVALGWESLHTTAFS